MYFEGWLFSVGEHVIEDVPQSGLDGAGPEDKERKKRRKGREKIFATSTLPQVVSRGIRNFRMQETH